MWRADTPARTCLARTPPGQTDVDEDDIAFKKKQQEEKKAAQAYLDKGKKK